MCDTGVVVSGDGQAHWFAKNSDREPGEAQAVEHIEARKAQGAKLQATWISIDEIAPSFEVVLSRPAWMWGAEMGVNEHGVAIGNEAVFTRLPVAKTGLTGMDLLRIALERSRNAESAVDLITGLIEKYGQGGRCGYRSKGFRYHNAFVIVDREGAWLLETADRHWAAVRVARGSVRTTSNVLTIDAPPDRISKRAMDDAWRRGFWNGARPFSFRDAFASGSMALLSGGDVRRACTANALSASDAGAGVDFARCAAALRSHNGKDPGEGWRMEAPCAHAGVLPTRTAGQTTGSMIASLGREGVRVWATGTSAPCVSVFKPIALGSGATDTGPAPSAERSDEESLWWRHERLHRAVMQRGYQRSAALFERERDELERAVSDAASASDAWREHRERAIAWRAQVEAQLKSERRAVSARVSEWFWRRESKRDGL